MLPSILIVDDDEDILEFLKKLFKNNGYRVFTAEDANQAMSLAQETLPDILLLDIHLEGISGWELLKLLRSDPKTRGTIVMLMSGLSVGTEQIVRGFSEGADDFITKPIRGEVLLARAKAFLRRRNWTYSGTAFSDTQASLFKTKDETLEVNVASRTVLVRAGKVGARNLHQEKVELSKKEFDLLCYFLSHPGVVLERQTLLSAVWGIEAEVYTRTVDKHVENLRKKLGPGVGKFIQTIAGVGYKFEE